MARVWSSAARAMGSPSIEDGSIHELRMKLVEASFLCVVGKDRLGCSRVGYCCFLVPGDRCPWTWENMLSCHYPSMVCFGEP